ncbi:MAG: glycoside hydrolase [Bacteroidaceae bacterium]
MKLSFISVLCVMLSLSASAQDVKRYLVHSSQNVLGCNSDKRAVLVDASGSESVLLTLLPQSDGTTLLAMEGSPTLYLSLGSVDGWSTFFLSDPDDARAHYNLEQQGGYTLLRNSYTGGYLGTDANTVGSHVYSDKSGTDVKHMWLLSETTQVTLPVDTLRYVVSATSRRQQLEGWGVSLCWWANMCGKWNDTKITELVRWMTSPMGLNMNVFRYNIGGGDDPAWTNCEAHHMGQGKGLRAEMEGFQDERGGEFLWERDQAQRKIMLKIKELRPDAVFEAFSNSPPWWMTRSGCVAGYTDASKDNLNTEYYEDFARYLVEVCKHYRDEYGIEFKTLEPFNEPLTSYWGCSGGQEGCHFDTQSQVNFLRVLAPVLKESGLNTIVSTSDETNTSQSLQAWDTYQQQGALSLTRQWNTHTYSATNAERAQLGSLARAAGKELWMSETGSGGTGIGGNLAMAQRLMDDMRYLAPQAWCDWQYVEEGSDQWSLVTGSFTNATYERNKNYYVREQITRFIRQGYDIVSGTSDHALCAVNAAGDTLVAVLLNNSNNKQIHQISLPCTRVSGYVSAYRTSSSESVIRLRKDYVMSNDSTLEVTMPEQSIATFVIPITPMTENRPLITDGDTYMILPQANCQVAIKAKDDGVIIAEADENDPDQQWILKKQPDDTWYLQTKTGRQAISDGSYYLKTSTTDKAGYELRLIDGIHYRIMLPDGIKCWDLEGTKTTSGTKVGVWEAGTSASAHHRQWQLVRVGGDIPLVPDGISKITVHAQNPRQIYSLQGIRLPHLRQGINIVRSEDGKVNKVIYK